MDNSEIKFNYKLTINYGEIIEIILIYIKKMSKESQKL